MLVDIVIAIYSKTAGKNARHASVTSLSNISAASRISVQVFSPVIHGIFRSVGSLTMPYQTKAFAHILPQEFIVILKDKPNEEDEMNIVISRGDTEQLKDLKAGISQFSAAVRVFLQRKN
ncbi:hypothetical protein AN958_07515 [Leucoagaricus sp. SymC.cos]|nr:hypothetical protein AN958_07515 [Leucoagaricus sp. SymC.cos]